MMIKAEIIEDRALLLDGGGRVWEFKIGYDDQPVIRQLDRVSHETIKHLIEPSLARFFQR